MLVGLHVMLADLTRSPEIAITDDEGAAFMKSAQNVMRHYSVTTTQKTLDWIAFAGCTVGIYGPRIVAIATRPDKSDGKKVVQLREVPKQDNSPASAGSGIVYPNMTIIPDEHPGAAE